MRVLVTGGAGLIGSHLCAELVEGGHDVVAFDSHRFSYGREIAQDYATSINYRFQTLLKRVKTVQGCLSEKVKVRDVILSTSPDVVVHLASIPLVGFVGEHHEQASQSMSQELLNLLEAVRAQKGCSRFVYVSSSMVYGDFVEDGVKESAHLDPISVYGGLKLAGEILTRAYLKGTGIAACIVRPSGVYGPTETHDRVVRKFCRAAMSGEPIELTEETDFTIDFTYVDDAVRGLRLAATHKAAADETFNISFGRGRRLSELADILSIHHPGIKRSALVSFCVEAPQRGSLSIEKAARMLGYVPEWSLEAGIAAYLRWLRSCEVMERAAA